MRPDLLGPHYSTPTKPDAWLYLDEITHRTLNDYTAMLAVLRSASVRADETIQPILTHVTKRLEAAAAAYTALRPIRGVAMRNLDEDLEQLCASLTSSVLEERSISLTLTSESVCLSARRCWQICLIVSELVMNAAKHAFSGQGGSIFVTLLRSDDKVQCVVMDDGGGSVGATPGRGSQIIDALAVDLDGAISRHFSPDGLTVVVNVPAT